LRPTLSTLIGKREGEKKGKGKKTLTNDYLARDYQNPQNPENQKERKEAKEGRGRGVSNTPSITTSWLNLFRATK